MASETLRILHFNDVYHVAAGTKEPVGGAARFAHLMHTLQQDPSPTLTLFSGDAYFPSLESSISCGEHMLPVLNKLGIDAATLGNHEFDQGIEVLEGLIKRNNFPWVISNLTDKDTGGPAASGSVTHLVKQVGGMRVGIIGIVEKEWLDTLPCLPPTFQYHDFILEARKMAERLRDRSDPDMSCDLVICLSHMRLPNDIKLADACKDVVDLVLSGHDHFYYLGSGIDTFEDPLRDQVPEDSEDVRMFEGWQTERKHLAEGEQGRRLVKSGTDFRDLSEIQLTLDRSSKLTVSRVSVVRHRVTKAIEEEKEISEMVEKIEAHLSKAMDKVVGYTTTPWDARSTVCRTQESNIGNLSGDLMRLCYAETIGVQIGFLCGGTIRSDKIYETGQVKMRDIMEIFPFDDPVVVVKLTGDQIRRALENGVSKWPAQEGRFPQVSGLRFQFDPRRPPGDRVTSIMITASAKAAARAGQQGIEKDQEKVELLERRAKDAAATPLHRVAMKNSTLAREDSATPMESPQMQSRRGSDTWESDTDVDSEYGGEEDEILDMDAEYIVATRDYMYQGHDGYEALNEGELLLDEESGISFSDLYRRFFHGLAVTNALKFKLHGHAQSCSIARHESLQTEESAQESEQQVSSKASEWKRLIIKHAENLRALAKEKVEEPKQGGLACAIAGIVQKYHDRLAAKSLLRTHRRANVVKALLSSAERLPSDQQPLRVARTALFGHEDTSRVPLPCPQDESVPRNDDLDGLLPGVPINRKDTRSYASEELIARWAVVSPLVDGRIANVSDLKP
ncbi:hypothetical protein FBU59_001401 [Linderina macrospora]|uniref:Uncharacterized protein n=1 Tax=Linderina macrospora TaxID=4868 RepID=A0ACC1JE57_9FUNG|nr:hypothetical protein FBU59_001401 [Linderina macrospora]